jgi:hypothetical protein
MCIYMENVFKKHNSNINQSVYTTLKVIIHPHKNTMIPLPNPDNN